GRNILEHARRQGELLIKARSTCGPRKFRPWRKEQVPFSEGTVYAYIKIAENWEDVIPLAAKGITLRDALKYVKDLARQSPRPSPQKTKAPKPPPEDDGMVDFDFGTGIFSRYWAERLATIVLPKLKTAYGIEDQTRVIAWALEGAYRRVKHRD